MHKYSTSKWFFIALLCTDCTDCTDFLRCVPCGSTNRNMFIEKPGFLKALASQCPIHQFHALRISCGFKIVLHICLGFDDQVSHNRNYNITLHHFISSQFSCRKSRSMNSNTDKKIPKIVSTTANFGHWVEEHCLFAWLQVRRIHLGDAIKV